MVHMNGNINQHIQSMHSIFMKICVCGGGGEGSQTLNLVMTQVIPILCNLFLLGRAVVWL